MKASASNDSEFAQLTHNHLVRPALALLAYLAADVASTVFSLFWL